MNFPTHIRTKAEANALAQNLFPDHDTARDRIQSAMPGDQYPFFWIEHQVHTDLRALFEWLFDHKTRIYKRHRWNLFYDLAFRLIGLLKDNTEAKGRHWHQKMISEPYNCPERANIMTGEGDGI